MKILSKKLKEILKEINDNYSIFCDPLYDSRYNDDSEIDIMEIFYYNNDHIIKITNVDGEELFVAFGGNDNRSPSINTLEEIIKTNIPDLIECDGYVRGGISYVDLANYYDYNDNTYCNICSEYIYFCTGDLVIYYDDIKWDVTDDEHENHIFILRAIKNAIDNKAYNTDNERVRSRVDDILDKMSRIPDSIKVQLEI